MNELISQENASHEHDFSFSLLPTFSNLPFILKMGAHSQEASPYKPLQREIFKTLYNCFYNSPFSLPLITSLMPRLKSLFFIDFI